jgi:hypothetical protein
MSVLDTTFAYFTAPLKSGYVWTMDATLTGTRLSNLPAFVALASGPILTYVPGSPATISFGATLKYQHPSGGGGSVTVTLIQNPGSVYNMTIVLPKRTVNCVANIDTASGVVYGSEGTQFVTLVLNPGSQQG